MMVAILQLKASTLNVYIVSFTVVIFTILNDITWKAYKTSYVEDFWTSIQLYVLPAKLFY